MSRITSLRTLDVRAPTSRTLAGSDAVHGDPDYSGAYVFLETDAPGPDGHALVGVGMTFTIGAGNDLVCAAIDQLGDALVGREISELVADLGGLAHRLANHSQLRWLGPEKGVIHLATAALLNAVWDLRAKCESVPLWQLVCSMSSEEIVSVVDWRYLGDALERDEALDMLLALEPTRQQRIDELMKDGYPAYITSAGWLGYGEEKVRLLCREALSQGWTSFKTKVGIDVESDQRRCEVMREEIGAAQLMADANQVWDVQQAITWTNQLRAFDLRWIEEPTSPDDILGHAAIRRGVSPIGVASGEHAANRVMFKQFFQAKALDYCQIDACRVGGVNEVLAILLLAAKFDVPVCPHAGGLGLCEYVQHLSIIDFVCVSGSLRDRTTEYADHLHEHFVNPAVVRNGHYVVPTAAGYSIDMYPESYAALAWPNGTVWK